MLTDEDVEAARSWREAVEDALSDTADQHGLDPDTMLDPTTREGQEFLTRLDPLVTADPTQPEFARAVEAAVLLYAGERRAATPTTLDVRLLGRVLESRGTDAAGGKVYRVRMIRYGESRNRRRYTEAVMRRAAHLYEGAKAYDHHRDQAELASSTISGLVGQYRNVAAEADGLYADLHLLPGAAHAAEALDASIAAQAAGLPPLIGISHDVRASFKPVREGKGFVQEAVAIEKVQSTDLVADPSAGGRAVRAVQGGITEEIDDLDITESTEEDDVPTTESVLAALDQASDAQLATVGLTRAAGTRTTEASSLSEPKGSFLASLLIDRKLADAGMASVREAFVETLPDRVTEATVDQAIAAYKTVLAGLERSGLAPTVTVTRESRDKKIEALDAFFAGDFSKGYRSFKAAFTDITGHRPDFLGTEDLNRRIIRESYGHGYDSDERATESADTSTWAQLLGDSVTRRVVAEYAMPTLQTWRQIVSDIQPIEDFRTQRVGRMGGYGTLPAVAQGGPYQPLTTPADEEATYAITKRGGTEDLTLETIANDDRRVISKIPQKLGRAAAQTLYRFVWDMLVTPVTCTYDSVALFHADHGNTDTSSALTQTTVGVGRRKMRDQAAYGDTSEILGLQPRFLVVPNELEELAWQICTSAVAIPSTPASASDSPNINSAQGLTPILVPYLTDANDWFLVADPNMTPTIEIGFYQGRQEPEIFTQSDPNVGSVFNSDVFTWKIRHIYSGTALDHRGFYRGVG